MRKRNKRDGDAPKLEQTPEHKKTRISLEDQVQAQAHHPLQTTSKDGHTALLFSSFAIA